MQNLDSGLVIRADAARWRPFPLSIIQLQRPPDVNNMHLSRSNQQCSVLSRWLSYIGLTGGSLAGQTFVAWQLIW